MDDECCSAYDIGLNPPCGCASCKRERYVYEGPNGSPRPKAEVSPDTKLRVPIADLARLATQKAPTPTMSIISRLSRTAYAVLNTSAGAIVGADIFGEPSPTTTLRYEQIVLFETVGVDMERALDVARARLLTPAYNWIGPVADHPGSRGAYRVGPTKPPRPLEHRPTTIGQLVSDAVVSILQERRALVAPVPPTPPPYETLDYLVMSDVAWAIGQRAHAWISDYGLARAAEPACDPEEVTKLRAGLKAIANHLGLAIDASDKARGEMWDAVKLALDLDPEVR